jgi:hypothetical protein
MSTQGGDAASAASAAHSDDSHDLLGLGDTTSSQGSGHLEQRNALNDNRNVSGSSNIYFDATDSGESSFIASDKTKTRSQLESGAGEGGARLKGKETYSAGLEEPQRNIAAEASSISQSSGELFVEEVRRPIPRSAAEAPKPTRIETLEPRVSAPNLQPIYNHRIDSLGGSTSGAFTRIPPSSLSLSDMQGNIKEGWRNVERILGGSTSGGFTRMPPSSLRSSSVQGNTEEARRNWERIQAIGGPSTSRNNYVPSGPAALPEIAAQSPSRAAQKRKSGPGDNASGLDGIESDGSAATSGHFRHFRPPPYEVYSSGGNTSRESLTSRRDNQQPSQEVVVPRWQPDAEVTFCPICSTQFSECSAKTCRYLDILTV